MSAVRPPPSVRPGQRPLVSQLARFASWGVVNTLVDFVVYVVLAALGVGFVLANLASTSCGLAVAFYGNRRFVFGRGGRTSRELPLFLLVAGIGVWVVQPLVIAATSPLVAQDAVLPGTHVWVPKVAAIAVAAVWNFVLYKNVVFRGTAGRPAPEAS